MLEIQRIRPEEGKRLREIRLSSLIDAPGAFAGTYEQALLRAETGWSRQIAELPTFVAVFNGLDAGMVRTAPATDRQAAAFVLSMWVAACFRGQGVGDALMDAVIAWARAEHLDELILDVGADNASAISLYSRKGFRCTGETGALPPPREHIGEQRMALRL
jgi:ribosomal protein S18 acetylase RimI-like enzyme